VVGVQLFLLFTLAKRCLKAAFCLLLTAPPFRWTFFFFFFEEVAQAFLLSPSCPTPTSLPFFFLGYRARSCREVALPLLVPLRWRRSWEIVVQVMSLFPLLMTLLFLAGKEEQGNSFFCNRRSRRVGILFFYSPSPLIPVVLAKEELPSPLLPLVATVASSDSFPFWRGSLELSVAFFFVPSFRLLLPAAVSSIPAISFLALLLFSAPARNSPSRPPFFVVSVDPHLFSSSDLL